MIKNAYVDPLQESMEIKMYEEKYAHVAPSEFAIGLEGAYMHAAQIEQNFNALMEQVGVADLKYYSETGITISQGYYLEADGALGKAGTVADEKLNKAGEAIKGAKGKAGAAIKNFADKVVKFLQWIKEALASAWKKVKNMILDLDVANKAFLAKYSVQLKGQESKEITLNTFKFPGLQVNSEGPDFEGAVKALATHATGSDQGVSAARMTFRRALVPGIKATDSSESFTAAAKEFIYGEKGETSQSAGAALNFIKNTRMLLKTLNKQYTKADKAIDTMIKDVQKQAKAEKDPNIEAALKSKLASYKEASKDMQAFCQIRSKALVDRLRYSKAICVKALQGARVGDADADKAKAAQKATARIGESASIEDIFSMQLA